MHIPPRVPYLALPAALALTGCGAAGATPAADDGRLAVTASFYPVQYLAERVGGEHVDVSVLTRPGVDPHEVELTPREVGQLGAADVVVYSAGLQPAVDQAVTSQAGEAALDVAGAADLLALGETDDEHAAHAEDGHGDADGPAEEDHEHASHEGHDHGGVDPHFWLDPERYGHVAETIAARFAEVDPAHAEDYERNAAQVVADLDALDAELADGLATCERRDLVTTHEAFGYLAHRYDLHLVGITGISPEAEPSPARLAEVVAQVDQLGVDAVFTEPLLPAGIAETVARETGARVLTLDPVEGITDASAGQDYLAVMRADLAALRDGLSCS